MWFDLAVKLGQTLRHVKLNTTSREFVRWQAYFEQCHKEERRRRLADLQHEIDNPTINQQYMMQLTSWVATQRLNELRPRNDFKLNFEIIVGENVVQRPEAIVEQSPEEEFEKAEKEEAARRHRLAVADDIAKQKMFGFLGTPKNFEGWKT